MSLGSLLLSWRQPARSRTPTTGDSAGPGRFSKVSGLACADDSRASDEKAIHELRYATLLSPEPQDSSNADLLRVAWRAMDSDMALVPAGHITLGGPQSADASNDRPVPLQPKTPVMVQSFYLDRLAVRNRDFARFVAAGGYDRMELWPEEVWPSVVQFVDQTGLPGPRFWSQGRPVRGKDDHPVVGICWFEANAYALWVGKRLPTTAEWEKTASWPADLMGRGPTVRYPWGNAFDPSRANIWTSGVGTTVEVDQYPNGCTPNGIYQLVGNVWEWTVDRFTGPDLQEGLHVFFDQPMGEIRGAAFDTYFEVQATCQFRTGQSLLGRRPNIGFRCAVGVDALRSRGE